EPGRPPCRMGLGRRHRQRVGRTVGAGCVAGRRAAHPVALVVHCRGPGHGVRAGGAGRRPGGRPGTRGTAVPHVLRVRRDHCHRHHLQLPAADAAPAAPALRPGRALRDGTRHPGPVLPPVL
ncbi:MAG: hypothetical protein AVDCRST_MAG50-1627, partial [uncultured Acidimicrobiales bacterium]